MIILFIIIALSLYGLLNFYVGVRIFSWLRLVLPLLSGRLFWVIYVIIALSFFAVAVLPTFGFIKYIGIFANYWLGIFFYLLLVLLVMDGLRLLSKYTGLLPSSLLGSPEMLLITGVVVLLIVAICFTYGVYNAHRIKVSDYDIIIEKAGNGRESLNLVMISDLHLGYINGYNHVKKIIDSINEINPDIVCIAGDFFDGDYTAISRVDDIIGLFKQIKSTYGIYACLGNHDAGNTFPEMLSLFKREGIILLQDESVLIDNSFIIVGRADSKPIGSHGESRQNIKPVMAKVDSSKPVIMLDHQPSNIQEAESEGVDLLLSGHTHMGQVFPGNIITKLIFAVNWGYLQSSNLQIIVSSGVGTWGPPMRIGSSSEIVHVNIRFENNAQLGAI